MKRIVFVRHGESAANAGGPAIEHGAIPLTELGHKQAQSVVSRLPARFGLVLVSPMIRTQQTAAPYCDSLGVEPSIDARLSEFSMLGLSLVAGMTTEQRKPQVDAYWAASDPNLRLGSGAETFFEFDARVKSFAGQLPELPDQTVIFGHGIWFGLLCWRLQGGLTGEGAGMGEFRRFQLSMPIPNCGVFELRQSNRREWAVAVAD